VENLLGRNNYKSNFVVVVVSGDWPHLTASETSTVRCCCEICWSIHIHRFGLCYSFCTAIKRSLWIIYWISLKKLL